MACRLVSADHNHVRIWHVRNCAERNSYELIRDHAAFHT